MTFVLAFLLACSTPAPTPAAPTAAAPTPAAAPAAAAPAHADAGVSPGPHEDWCVEHAVPESQCTLCNPSLAAAFKATDDWCEEHGLPESHCRKCNPELKIERPPKSSPPTSP